MPYYEYLDYKEKEYKRNMEKYNSINEKREELKSRIKEAEKWSNKGVNKKKKDNDNPYMTTVPGAAEGYTAF